MTNDFPSSIYVSREQELALEDARVEAYHERIANQANQDEECPHETHMGTCIGCGASVTDDFDELSFDPGPRKLTPRDVLSTDDLNLLSELVAEATEGLERKARIDVFEASYYRHRIKVYRDLLNRLSR